VTAQNNDTFTLTYGEYIKQKMDGNYVILDIYDRPFKTVTMKDSLIVKEQLYVDSELIQVDTTIMVGFDTNRININSNEGLLFQYSNYIIPPKFESSNGDKVIFSFLLDENGKVQSIKILKDVTMKCNDSSKWKINYTQSIIFNPTIINGKKYKVNYIVQLEEISYCLCTIVTKESIVPNKKRWKLFKN
jgi:hypothetical protein